MKLIPRASDQDHLVQDQNVEAVSSLYIPYSGESDPSIGGNDPVKLGAISTGTTDSITYIDVYQGAGEWKRILYSASGTAIVDLEFSGTDVEDPTGNPYILLYLSGTQRPFSVSVNGDVITGFSYQRTVNGNLYGIAKADGSSWGSGDVIMVAIVGEPSTFVATLRIENNSSSNVDYTSGGSSATLLPTQVLNTPTIPGQTVSLDLIDGQSSVYTIRNSDGSVYYTHDLVGPGTENGIAMTNDKSQTFIISNT